jgi:predicted DNA-binding transcriptional regulator AlpA
MTANHSDRLETWKEIAAYLGRDLRTVMRWEKERSLPVHRLPGGGRAAVYAYRSEIDNWLNKSPGPLVGEAPSDASEGNPRTTVPADNSRASSKKTRGWRNAAVAVLVAAIILLITVLALRKPSSADEILAEDAISPAGIKHKIKISLVNDEPEAVPGPFQQMLTVDSSRYASVESPNLQNVEFFDSSGRILKSWLESGNSHAASRTIYWIQLPKGIPASTVLTVYMGFADREQNLFNTATTGEAPGLSPTYGTYDDGNAVFSHYANFAGAEMPTGWYKGTTPGGHGELRIDNGVFLAHSGRGGGSVFIGSDWSLGNNIAEMDLLSQQTTRGQEMLFVCSANPTSFHWTANSVGYQDMSGLEVEANNEGTPLVVATANPNPPPASVIGFQDGTVIDNYQPVIHLGSRICGGDYLASTVSTGFNASFSFDWIRMRLPSPHGNMPATIFGQLK